MEVVPAAPGPSRRGPAADDRGGEVDEADGTAPLVGLTLRGCRLVPLLIQEEGRPEPSAAVPPSVVRTAAPATMPKAALVAGNYRFNLPCEVETAVGGDGSSTISS